MAQIITPLRKKDMQIGEWRFANLLRGHLDDEYLVWYNIAATNGKQRRYPDFLIFHGGYGLWCLEIKDWHWGNVLDINPDSVRLKVRDQSITNATLPIKQARDCCLPVIDRMKKDRLLCHLVGKYQGKLLFPWGFGAVMSNWQRENIYEKMDESSASYEICFPPHLIWYKEDLMEGHLSREDFLAKLHGMLPYRFPVALNHAQMQQIRAHIYPEFIIGGQDELFHPDRNDYAGTVKIMDIQQERIARELGGGHRVIHGVAGSGKTIILQHRACKLAAENKKPVLVICYNIMLASILKSRLEKEPNVQICHFHDWCGQLKAHYHIEVENGKNYPDRLAQAVCAAIANGRIPPEQYHAVLIDEGHDFNAEWLQALAKMPDGAQEHLLLLYDDAQTLYPDRHGMGFTLASVGIKAQGRTRILQVNYRNSEEIHRYASRFIHHFINDTPVTTHNDPIDEDRPVMTEDTGIPILASKSGGGHTGIPPEFAVLLDTRAEMAKIIERIHQWRSEGAAWGDIAVLYYKKDDGAELAAALRRAGIPLRHPVNKAERMDYRPHPGYALVCTIHSSKGGEFPRVIVSGVHSLPDKAEKQQEMARLLYVGMTRAQTHLLLTAAGENAYTRLLAPQ